MLKVKEINDFIEKLEKIEITNNMLNCHRSDLIFVLICIMPYNNSIKINNFRYKKKLILKLFSEYKDEKEDFKVNALNSCSYNQNLELLGQVIENDMVDLYFLTVAYFCALGEYVPVNSYDDYIKLVTRDTIEKLHNKIKRKNIKNPITECLHTNTSFLKPFQPVIDFKFIIQHLYRGNEINEPFLAEELTNKCVLTFTDEQNKELANIVKLIMNCFNLTKDENKRKIKMDNIVNRLIEFLNKYNVNYMTSK